MWKQEKNDSVILHLALSLALATTPLAANVLISVPVLAESTSNVSKFPLPQTVESGTKVRIDGSMSLLMINQSLKDNFEKQFSGTEVEIGINGTDAALKAVIDGEIDIAAIARGLTPEEKAQGLEQIRLRREKIAIIVGANNPFQGSLTSEQFAKIFRGEITDWSELGSPASKIRLVDRPLTSDTRNSFRDYPVFKSAEFVTSGNVTQLDEDKTALIIKELGTDGISYARANQVSKLPDVRVLKIQGLTPDDSQYPFSQPLVYVYKQNPSLATASFLGFTTAPVGQKAIEAARDAEASAIAASSLQNFTLETATSSTPKAQSVETPASSENPSSVATSLQTETLPTTNNSGNQQFVNPFEDRNITFLIVLSVLPIVGLGSFFAWWLKRKHKSDHANISPSETSTVSPATAETILTIPDEDSITSNHTTPTNGTSHSNQSTNLIISKPENNPTFTGKETLSSSLKPVTSKPTNTTTEVVDNIDITTQTIALDCGEVVWDTEAPVAFVNNPYPSVPNIPETAFNNLELPTDELTSSLLELLDEPAASSAQESHTSLSKLLDEPAASSALNSTSSLSELLDESATSSAQESHISLSESLGFSTDTSALNSTSSLSELLNEPAASSAQESHTSLSESLGFSTDTSALNSTSSLSELLDEPAALSAQEPHTSLSESLGVLANSANGKSNTSLSQLLGLKPEAEKLDIDIFPEQSLLESKTPTHTNQVSGWSNMIGDSSIVFTPRTPKWAYVSWYVSETQKEAAREIGGTTLAVRLYDATDIDLSYQIPQLVQQYECEEVICDCYVAIPTSNRDYMTEMGYITNNNDWLCIARSSTVRIFSRPGTDFWFVADTELVIHGSTEPGATVTIGGYRIKLNPDGTFHLRVPFSDKLFNYLMTATAADGEQSITILNKFFQDSSET